MKDIVEKRIHDDLNLKVTVLYISQCTTHKYYYTRVLLVWFFLFAEWLILYRKYIVNIQENQENIQLYCFMMGSFHWKSLLFMIVLGLYHLKFDAKTPSDPFGEHPKGGKNEQKS